MITRGSTLSRIAAAIKAANPCVKVYGVALAKTERRSYFARTALTYGFTAALLVFLAVVVGSIVLAMFWPLIKIIDSGIGDGNSRSLDN